MGAPSTKTVTVRTMGRPDSTRNEAATPLYRGAVRRTTGLDYETRNDASGTTRRGGKHRKARTTGLDYTLNHPSWACIDKAATLTVMRKLWDTGSSEIKYRQATRYSRLETS